ncbi:hypothetical protein Tco_0240229, partial [Tanacetum coccineum]
EVGEASTVVIPQEDGDNLLPGIEVKDAIEPEIKTAPVSIYAVGESSIAAIPQEDGDNLGNEVHSSVEQGMATMEKLVEKLGNTEDRVECKKLKKQG